MKIPSSRSLLHVAGISVASVVGCKSEVSWSRPNLDSLKSITSYVSTTLKRQIVGIT